MDNYLYIIFVIIAAAASWLQKRRESKQETSWEEVEGKPSQPKQTKPVASARETTPSSPAPKKKISWEQELRRLLEGQVPPASESKPKPSPEIPRRTERRVVQEAPPPLVRQERSTPPPPPVPVVTKKRQPAKKGRSVTEARKEAERLRAEADAYLGIHERKSRKRTPVQANAISMLRNPQTARQAIIASIIVAPPKALEEASPV